MFKSLSRRSFFKTAAAGAAAAPMVAHGVSAITVPPMGSDFTPATTGIIGSGYWDNPATPCETGDWLQSSLSDNLKRLMKPRRPVNGQDLLAVSRLDPDIHDAKSFSNAAKFRMQAQRNVEREYAQEMTYVGNEIASLKKRLGLA